MNIRYMKIFLFFAFAILGFVLSCSTTSEIFPEYEYDEILESAKVEGDKYKKTFITSHMSSKTDKFSNLDG